MNIFISGGTGFIGNYLTNKLLREDHFLTLITRSPGRHEDEEAQNQRFVSWDDNLAEEMDRADVVINMAGYSIFGQRWTEKVKQKIHESRICTTRKIVEAIADSKTPPEVMISASAAGYYGDRGNQWLDESVSPGDDFLARVCIDWEKEAQKVTEYGVRLANPRIGIVMEKDGGALKQMLPAFRYFVGGAVGSGDQYFPWIHMQDICRGLIFPMKHEHFEGAYNLSSPHPVTMNKFAQVLASTLQRPHLFRVPEWALKLLLGEAASPITNSLRLKPEKLLEAEFEFRFKRVEEALGDIV